MSLINWICCIHFLLLVPYIAESRQSSRNRERGSSSTCRADAQESWSYRGRNGPKHWGELFRTCNGRKQSPIAIHNRDAVPDRNLARLKMNNYDRHVTRATIENNGHTIQITPTDRVSRTIYVNDSTYTLNQLHFHWGDRYHRGSEHTLDGIQFAMEAHFVHENRYNQVAVVGVFFQEQNRPNRELDHIVRELSNVQYKDMRAEMRHDFNLNKLLPANPSSFYRYMGSLTTPNCTEGVTWSVLTKPIVIGKDQTDEFRKLFSATRSEATSDCRLINNYRPVQPLNGRTVYISQ